MSNVEMRTNNGRVHTKSKMDKSHSIPKTIGNYRIVEILGEGGMSVVYTAMQEHPRRKVAIKVLRGGMYSPTAAKRFHQEVEILGRLDHPWIARIFDAGTHDDGNGATPYYVMEHVGGSKELTDYLQEVDLDRREVLKLFAMISSAVEHGHHRGVVHRDLKPGNILIDKVGEPKIIDFGVARSLDRTTVGDEAMTEAGRLVGTVQFMAPEQVDAKITDIDARCDVYALGAVLYQMLTGRLPRTLEGLPIYEAVRQICQETPTRPTTYDGTIDQNLEAIVMMALETNREKRYQSAGAFGRDILRYLGNRTIKARKASSLDRVTLFAKRHKNQLTIGGAVALLFVIALVAFMFLRAESDQQIGDLQAQIDMQKEENQNLQNTANQPPKPAEEKQKDVEPVIALDTPSNIVVSTSGKTLAGIVGEDYIAIGLDGKSLRLPSVPIEPNNAMLQLSDRGTKLAILSGSSGRVYSLNSPAPPVKLTGDFENPISIALSEKELALTFEDMSIRLIGARNQEKRALSNTGEYKAISFATTGEQVVAATDQWVYMWLTKTFPKGVRKLKGVHNPCCIGSFGRRIVVVGTGGVVVVHEPNKKDQTQISLSLESDIAHAALNIQATVLGYISNGKAYKYSFLTGETTEASWLSEEPVGVAIGEGDTLIVWTADGKVFNE